MKNIILVRHGETDWNKIGRVQGYKNSKLTELGVLQANKAGVFLKENELGNIDKIYSSDLDRAFNTAEIINNYLNLNIVKTELLREKNFGSWEGKTKEEILKFDKSNYEKWVSAPEKTDFKDGESLEDLKRRCNETIKFIENENFENILVVSHSATIKMLILSLLDMDIKHFKNLSLGNTGITKIKIRDYNTVLQYYNSTFHLKGDYYE